MLFCPLLHPPLPHFYECRGSAGHSELSVRHLLTSRVPSVEQPSVGVTVLDLLRQDTKYKKEYLNIDFNALPEGRGRHRIAVCACVCGGGGNCGEPHGLDGLTANCVCFLLSVWLLAVRLAVGLVFRRLCTALLFVGGWFSFPLWDCYHSLWLRVASFKSFGPAVTCCSCC